jgi:hypothetical protein
MSASLELSPLLLWIQAPSLDCSVRLGLFRAAGCRAEGRVGIVLSDFHFRSGAASAFCFSISLHAAGKLNGELALCRSIWH